MNSLLKKISLVGSGALLMLLAFSFISQPLASAATPSQYSDHLIDNGVMRDASTMSVADIQAFLQSKGSGLASFTEIEDCGSPSGSHYAFYATYYSCGSRVSAAKIIYDSARAYGINPRVILATLQKEQSLVTTPNPIASQITYAMGYGCPDSGSCSYPGFFNQVDNGTWQFRVDMELSSGNSYWGYSPSSYPCNGATRYYTAALKAGNNVAFKDDAGNVYAQFVIPNAATATLYCYTPHVYPGSSQQYYSGSYWFVYYFNQWFGSTYDPSFSAQYVSQSAYPVIDSGVGVSVYFMFKNTGSSFWKDDASNFPGYSPIHFATTFPINRNSAFKANGWPASSRATGFFSAVYEADGITLASEQHTVQPGQIAKFAFTVYANPNIPGGVYREYFQPILEGAPGYMWNLGGWAYLDIGVNKPSYQATYAGQSTYPTLTRGGSASSSYLRFKNIGGSPWFDDTSVPSGKRPVHLATGWPINRGSIFNTGWAGYSRPNVNFSKVYQADGVTLSSAQHTVQPGQIVQYDFPLTALAGAQTGFYQEHFQPIVEGAPGYTWNMNADAWLGVTVN